MDTARNQVNADAKLDITEKIATNVIHIQDVKTAVAADLGSAIAGKKKLKFQFHFVRLKKNSS